MNFGDILKALTNLEKNIAAEVVRTKTHLHQAVNAHVSDQRTRNLINNALDAEVDALAAQLQKVLDTL